MIALIVGYTLHRQRKLRQQYQDKPIEQVTNFDLEVDIKGGQSVGGYDAISRECGVYVGGNSCGHSGLCGNLRHNEMECRC